MLGYDDDSSMVQAGRTRERVFCVCDALDGLSILGLRWAVGGEQLCQGQWREGIWTGNDGCLFRKIPMTLSGGDLKDPGIEGSKQPKTGPSLLLCRPSASGWRMRRCITAAHLIGEAIIFTGRGVFGMLCNVSGWTEG